jgi:type I restriction enzyme S subunit
MSFPRYTAYKEVPIPWIGQVPEHWQWNPIFASARERDEDNKGMKEDNLLSLSYGNIVNKDINTSDGLLPESFETYQIVRPGDIVLRLTDLQNDKKSLRSALVTQTGIITSAYLALEPKRIDSRYFNYLLRAYDVSKVFYSMGGGLRQSMKYGDIKRMPLVIPSMAEQLGIVNFLDHETARIDALITEQQRLIELLHEKRQTVISHAVTKGLNPDVPMKDSGVEWLGEVPEHWVVCNFQRFVQIAEGQVDPKQSPFADMPLIAPNHIQSGTGQLLGLETAAQQGAESGKYICNEGDVIYSKIRPSLRKACIAPCACLTSADMYPLRAHGRLSNEFLFRFLLSEPFSALAIVESERVAMPKINRDSLKSVALAIPPASEQEDICQFIMVHSTTLDALMVEAQEAIVLLSERRSALISAAVTGQIDVRGLAKSGDHQ